MHEELKKKGKAGNKINEVIRKAVRKGEGKY